MDKKSYNGYTDDLVAVLGVGADGLGEEPAHHAEHGVERDHGRAHGWGCDEG